METLELDKIITEALENSVSHQEYYDLLQQFAIEGKTTGPKREEDLIYYTKLNAQRSKRIGKTTQLDELAISAISSIEKKQTWLLITESWCGDAANSVPVIAKLAELNKNIDLRIVLRDEHSELMEQFLTNDGKSIPKLIVLDGRNEVIFTWGPRPVEAQSFYMSWRNSEDKVPYKEFQVELQKWYNVDRGVSLQKELSALVLGK